MSNGSLSREDALGEVGAGWAYLVNKAYDNLPEGSCIDCVKEKFAELRIYWFPGDGVSRDAFSIFDKLLDDIEDESGTICEYCGQPGTLHITPGRWRKTMCRQCAKERGAQLCQ
jgi:hypothetical protein